MLVADGAVAALLAAVSVYLIKAGIREWRGVGTPLSQKSATMLMSPGSRAGFDRAGLIFGLGFAFMALMIAGITTALQFRHPGHETRLVVGTLCSIPAVAMIVCIGLAWSIVSFNWPKALVPPQHRDEPGALASTRRRPKGRIERPGTRD